MIKKLTQRLKQAIKKSRPIGIVSSRAFGIKVLNEVRASMDAPALLEEKQCSLMVPDWGTMAAKIDIDKWAEPLLERYKGNKFDAYIVQGLAIADALAGVALREGKSAGEALKLGLERAAWAKKGYFLVVVSGNKNRLKDALVMDYENKRWLSINKSKGDVIARHHIALLEKAKQERAQATYPIEQQGIWIESIGEKGEGSIVRITTDGLIWHNLDADEGLGYEIEEAWYDNYYIQYYPHEHKAFYSGNRNGPFFTTVEEARVGILAMLEGLDTVEQNHHPVVKFAQDTLPNVFLQTKEGLIPVAGQAVTDDEYSRKDVIELAKDLRNISQETAKTAPQRKIIYHRPTTNGQYVAGQIGQYISYAG